ncbi:putative DNA binding protein [Bdellovibrio phage phiMH2K]|uniref:DNA binding protein VP8 n=1 Tax=Bdellovibrio phage phiMH2K TaxID=145579 RepID=J_BPPHM|nr:putative DNA binding protein [Bdellovibrio phage phiMH2K]Q9G051.1 RecName: Full=DNA binding protein VP8 [Bdellovibrio phage phiMH2K]AAG45348.1 putative DNA binding protein [Bdellovibrio phage phiMH2K]
MKRKPMSRKASQKTFKKNTGVQRMNHLNPRAMRGGIRL